MLLPASPQSQRLIGTSRKYWVSVDSTNYKRLTMVTVVLVLIVLSIIIHFSPSSSYPIPLETHTIVEKIFPPRIIYRADSITTTHTVPISAGTKMARLALAEANADMLKRSDVSEQDVAVTLVAQARTAIRDLMLVDDSSGPAPPSKVKPGTGAWYSMGIIAIASILLTGVLSGLTLGVMSVDMTKLRVWMRTGSEKRSQYVSIDIYAMAQFTYFTYRAQAIKIMALRRHPNWLLCTFILSGTMVAEGLPLALGQIFSAGAVIPFIIATILVVVFGQLIPQAIVPMYVLDIASRTTWFVHAMMWITAPLSVPLGWMFRWIKVLGKRKYGWRADGILDREELGEYLRLHEIGVGLGGTLDDKVGKILQILVRDEGGVVGKGESLQKVPMVDEAMLVDAKLLELANTTRCPFFIVSEGGEGSGVVAGAVLAEVIRASVALPAPMFIRDLPVHAVPLVRENCRLVALADWLVDLEERIAIVVSETEEIASGADGLGWSPGGQKGHGPPDQRPITRHSITPLGIIDTNYLLRRLFFGGPDTLRNHSGHPGSESTDRDVQHGENLPSISSMLTPLKAKVLPGGLRKRSNPHKFASVWVAPLEEDYIHGFRPVRPNPLANLSSSQARPSEFDSGTSEASVTQPNPAQAKVATVIHTKHTISPVGEEAAEETTVTVQITDRASKDAHQDSAHPFRIVSANAQPLTKLPSEHGSDSGQHDSAKSFRSARKYGPSVRFGRRDETLTDPAEDEVVRAIMRRASAHGSSENEPSMMRA